MKSILITIAFLLSGTLIFGQRKTGISNAGNGWAQSNNWSPSITPQNGDTVIIPAGVTMSVKTNIYTSTTNLTILIYGTLNFLSGGKINLGSASKIIVYTGGSITSTSSPSEVITIGGVTKFKGNVDGTIIGPSFASSASSVSPSGFSGSILPVKFQQFTAKISTQRQAVLNWVVADESDMLEYAVEKSTDGRNWQRFLTVAAKNTSSGNYNYAATDQQLGAGRTYYRIIGKSIDQNFYYSSIEQIEDKRAQLVSVYPNPASSVLKVITNSNVEEGALTIVLYNWYGAKIVSEQYKAGTSFIELNVQQFAKGNYTLTLHTEKGTKYNQQVAIR